VYLTLLQRLREALAAHIKEKYGIELAIALERPPKLELGEAASPVCFELAKRLKKAPRQIAQEIAASLPKIRGIARVDVAGGGYLNAFFDRSAFFSSLAGEPLPPPVMAAKTPRKVIVEHTSINPNKAAHIGHLRNAVLGDTMVRLLRHTRHDVAVQNYIDNTGVQVADVVIAFQQMEKRSLAEVKILAAQPGFDYLCWDLYAKATQFFEEDKVRAAKLRGETLKAIEEGRGETAEMGAAIADAVVGYHLRTMARLDIYYELLARESEILHLHFWDLAFEKLKASGAIQLATSGKNAGCWILPWKQEAKEVKEGKEVKDTKNPAVAKIVPAAESFTSSTSSASLTSDSDGQAKIIVRSNGTVTYVGKDIAYQLWKFGLLGKDFHYRRWPNAPGHKTLWATTAGPNESAAPQFGGAEAVYNVIDTRQAYLQDVVAEGLRALGHRTEAENSIHFDYEIVALTPRCAKDMGYELSPEEAKKPYVEVSGRKGFGVKADDLITRMLNAAEARVLQKHPAMVGVELQQTANALAVGALRFFLLKVTRNTIIAFDFDDALSTEGETGPYCQYAIVRARSIWRKSADSEPNLTSNRTISEAATLLRVLSDQEHESVGRILAEPENADIWSLILHAGALDYAVDAAIGAQEPVFVSKYAFQLAQSFNNFYHKHHILSEADETKRVFLLALTELVEKQLVKALDLLGIQAPEKM
jgi:arginyl-tRNA synthetase